MDQNKQKKEEYQHPRLIAKIEELRKRGLLTTAKAYIPPQDRNKQNS